MLLTSLLYDLAKLQKNVNFSQDLKRQCPVLDT
jgi:hypothetical protein